MAHVAESEHERYRRFAERLGGLSAVTDAELAAVVRAAASEPDPSVQEAELGLIADLPTLTAEQRDDLLSDPAFEPAHLQRRVQRASLLMRVLGGPLTEALFGECLAFADGIVHRALLQSTEITPFHLRALREHGANQAIRNIASERLRRRPCS